MTNDITDQDRSAYEWAQMAADNNVGPSDAPWRIVARHYLATVDAPDTTLAEELRHIAEHWEDWATDTITSAIRAAADRAEQIEQERDEARAEVKRLTAERTSKESLPVDLPDPADVKPGEAWIVETRLYGRGVAVRIADGGIADRGYPWAFSGQGTQGHFLDSSITLISRLVPAPRVITDPDELDKLATRAVILSTDGQADVYQHHRDGWVDITGTPMDSRSVIRVERAVTVLWEPGA